MRCFLLPQFQYIVPVVVYLSITVSVSRLSASRINFIMMYMNFFMKSACLFFFYCMKDDLAFNGSIGINSVWLFWLTFIYILRNYYVVVSRTIPSIILFIISFALPWSSVLLLPCGSMKNFVKSFHVSTFSDMERYNNSAGHSVVF